MASDWLHTSYFSKITDKAKQKILHPKSYGAIKPSDYPPSMRVVIGLEGSLDEGQFVEIFLVVDEQDGVIADFKYQCFGPPFIIAILEGLVELSLRKNYLQASRLSYELLDKHLRDRFDELAIPNEAYSLCNFVLGTFYQALDECDDIPLQDDQLPPPNPIDMDGESIASHPHFLQLSDQEKYQVIEEIIKHDIRPYVQLDEGNVIIKKIEGYQITITYQGSCTSCFSATGSTLNAIQQILQKKVNHHLNVIPDLASLGGLS